MQCIIATNEQSVKLKLGSVGMVDTFYLQRFDKQVVYTVVIVALCDKSQHFRRITEQISVFLGIFQYMEHFSITRCRA